MNQSQPSSPALPARTITVDAQSVSPCEMLAEKQQTALLLREPTPGEVSVNGIPSSVCTWLGQEGIDYNVQFIPVEAQTAVTAPGAVITTVNGFGAIQNVPDDALDGTQSCQITIDAGPNQSIRIQALIRPGGRAPGIDEQCRRANEVASMVMTTVVATASR